MAKKPLSRVQRQTNGTRKDDADLLKQIERLERKLKSRDRQVARLTSSEGGRKGKQIYFDEKALALRLGVEVKTLQNWRGQGKGPRFYKIGRSVRYRLRDILAFERSFRSGGGESDMAR